MNDNLALNGNIQERIYTIRNAQVMLDSDLADIYGIETKVFNQAVKRNIERFPEHFRFQLREDELNILKIKIATISDHSNLRSQIVTSGKHGGRRYLPYVFTEQGVSMLSAVLRSKTAIQVSIRIMDAFVNMRKFIATNAAIFQRLERVEQKQVDSDHKLEQVFKALEEKSIKPQHGIFYDEQIFDAYTFSADIIREARSSIILIDNFVDDSVLTLLNKRGKNVSASIYTKFISKQLELDLEKHNSQYPKIDIHIFKNAHDRFLIIDKSELYHFGASLKDLGKKWFAFSKMNSLTVEVLQKLKQGTTEN